MKKKFLYLVLIFFGAIFISLFFIKNYEKNNFSLKKKLIVGTEPYYFPMEFLDEAGNLQGFDIDLVKELGKYLRTEIEFKILTWEELFVALEKEKIDMVVASVSITPERMKLFTFSDPYFNAGQVVVIRKEDDFKSLEDLKEKKLGAQKDTTSEIEAQKITSPELVISFENNEIAKEALIEKQIDGLVIDLPAAQGLVNKNENLKILSSPFTQEFYGIVFKKENLELAERVNKALAKMKEDGKLEEIQRKWFKDL